MRFLNNLFFRFGLYDIKADATGFFYQFSSLELDEQRISITFPGHESIDLPTCGFGHCSVLSFPS
jgi:hypothetical protein